MSLDPEGAGYLSRIALPCLRDALAALDAMPASQTVGQDWLKARRAVVNSIGCHNDIIRLAEWIKRSPQESPTTKSRKNRKIQ